MQNRDTEEQNNTVSGENKASEILPVQTPLKNYKENTGHWWNCRRNSAKENEYGCNIILAVLFLQALCAFCLLFCFLHYLWAFDPVIVMGVKENTFVLFYLFILNNLFTLWLNCAILWPVEVGRLARSNNVWRTVLHSRSPKPRSFWPAPRIATSGPHRSNECACLRHACAIEHAWEWVAPFP